MRLNLLEKVRKLALFLRKGISDVLRPNRFGVSDQYPRHDLWPYGLDYTAKEMTLHYDITFDPNGIPMMHHNVEQGMSATGKQYYHPLKIAHYALASYNDHLKEDTVSSANQFRTSVRYLAKNAELGPQGGVVWRVPRSVSRYGTPCGHVSAIVQGLVISALCRSYLLDANEAHLELAKEAMRVLRVPVEKGGVLADSRWGSMYEEYPALPYSHVINGFIFCLMGLYDLKSVSESTEAARLFHNGMQTLRAVIPQWIEASWSKYDLRDVVNGEAKNYATLHYQLLHADQMEIMYRVTGEEDFRTQKEKIEKQAENKLFLVNVYVRKVIKFIL